MTRHNWTTRNDLDRLIVDLLDDHPMTRSELELHINVTETYLRRRLRVLRGNEIIGYDPHSFCWYTTP